MIANAVRRVQRDNPVAALSCPLPMDTGGWRLFTRPGNVKLFPGEPRKDEAHRCQRWAPRDRPMWPRVATNVPRPREPENP